MRPIAAPQPRLSIYLPSTCPQYSARTAACTVTGAFVLRLSDTMIDGGTGWSGIGFVHERQPFGIELLREWT